MKHAYSFLLLLLVTTSCLSKPDRLVITGGHGYGELDGMDGRHGVGDLQNETSYVQLSVEIPIVWDAPPARRTTTPEPAELITPAPIVVPVSPIEPAPPMPVVPAAIEETNEPEEEDGGLNTALIYLLLGALLFCGGYATRRYLG